MSGQDKQWIENFNVLLKKVTEEANRSQNLFENHDKLREALVVIKERITESDLNKDKERSVAYRLSGYMGYDTIFQLSGVIAAAMNEDNSK